MSMTAAQPIFATFDEVLPRMCQKRRPYYRNDDVLLARLIGVAEKNPNLGVRMRQCSTAAEARIELRRLNAHVQRARKRRKYGAVKFYFRTTHDHEVWAWVQKRG
jgi:hypothetical protein